MTGWKVKSANMAQPDRITCSLCKEPVVYIEVMPKQKIELLMEAYPHQEWFAYLAGTKSEQGNIFVTDISVPPHKAASGGYAEAEAPVYNPETKLYTFHAPENCVGVIHSHNSMGAFHSGTDDANVDRNYPVSITVAKRPGQNLEFDTVSFLVTPCGKATTGKAVVKYVAPKPLFDTETWLTGAKANIDKRQSVTVRVIPQTGSVFDVVPAKYKSYYQDWLKGEKQHYQPQKGKNKPPRDEHGHFLPRLDTKLGRKMNREGSMDDVWVDDTGKALTPAELEDFLENRR